MKVKYVKDGKLNYQGTQYHKGDFLDIVNFGKLPTEWFEVIEEKQEKPVKKIVIKETSEVIEDGNKKSAYEDLDSKKR